MDGWLLLLMLPIFHHSLQSYNSSQDLSIMAATDSESEESVRAEIEAARTELLQIDRDLSVINEALERLMTNDVTNSLKLSVSQVLGLPADAKPNFSVQLSSPVESKKIYCLTDPLDPKKEGSIAEFKDVDKSVATILITAYDDDILLGTSAYLDVSPLCDLQAKMKSLDVAIVANAEGQGETGNLLEPICTAVFRVEYEASTEDQKQELYELKSKNTSRREMAIDKLRKCAASLNRIKASKSSDVSTKETGKSPAVKSGFLNKKEKKQPFFLKRWYEKTLGPESLVRQLFPIFKNYILFFGAVAIMHFQGHQLALPPPV